MSSSWLRSAAVRRGLPWALWALAAAAAVPLAWTATGFGGAPAVAEARRLTLGCPRTSRGLVVREVLVTPGQAVEAGQVLARMDPGELDVELAVARRRLEELELTALKTSVDLGRLAADEQQERSELAQLEAAIAQESALASDRLTDLKYLTELKLRQAGLLARTRELEGAVSLARRGLVASTDRRPPGGRPPGAAAPARAAAEAQREEVRSLEALRDRLELRAPFAARVDAVLVRAGEVASGEQVIALVEERAATAVAWVDERWASRVQVGDRVRLVARDGAGPRIDGQITALGPSIAELPARLWPLPSQPRYGRAAYVDLERPAFLPGQALEATFLPARTGGR